MAEEMPAHKPNFSGYWRLVKHDNLDAFLKEAEIPWVVRKVMVKYCSNSVDIIHHAGATMRVTTVNAKTSWSRMLQEGRVVTQRDAEGSQVKMKSWWEGDFHKTRMEGGPRGAVESWRHVDCGLMIVKTTLFQPSGKNVSVLWFLEEMSVPGLADAPQIIQDQRRVEKATGKDNEYAQKLLQTKDKWETPADRYLSTGSFGDNLRKEQYLLHLGSRSASPPSSVISPGANFSPTNSTTNAIDAHSAGGSGALPPGRLARQLSSNRGITSSAVSDSERSEQTSIRNASQKLAESESGPHYHSSSGFREGERPPISEFANRRCGSYGQLSDSGAEKSVPSATRIRRQPESLEAQLSLKLQEYSENRSITSVLPVENPLASDEPELLEMSPEEAEGTQL